MSMGLKHLVTCRCTLPQFKRHPNPPMHQFTVFSVIGDDDKVVPKYARCNNCGMIHKVVEINRSEMLSKESMSTIITVDDIKGGLPPRLQELLEGNNVDLPTWELAKYIYDNKRWGEFVVLSSDSDADVKSTKYVRILGENMFDVGGHDREEVLK
jgi:hypothetical protein